jgi:glycosyltransferase involved in cell wall biosynthesis
MRVAVFTDNDLDEVNGVTPALDALLAHAPPDISPRIYTASSLATDTPHYLALQSVALPIPFFPEMDIYVPRSREYLRRVMADHVDVIHLTTPGPLGLSALWIASKTGVPLVGSLHTDFAGSSALFSGSRFLGALASQYLRWIYNHCAHTLVPSSATRELMISAGSPAHALGVWPRGVDTALFSPELRSTRLREQWRASDREPALLYVGRLSREKGLELLPELLYRLRTLGVRHRMILVGDGPLRRWLQEELPDAIFTGWLGRQALAQVFASADTFVFPSRTDTAGNAVLEAQASGLPVVVSDAGVPKEHMRPGVTGVVCESMRAREWATMLAELLSNCDLRQRFGVSARAYAKCRPWDRAMAPVYDAYRDCAIADRPLGFASASRHAHGWPATHADHM